MQKVSHDTAATVCAYFSPIFKGISGILTTEQDQHNHTKTHLFYVYQLNIYFRRLVIYVFCFITSKSCLRPMDKADKTRINTYI